MPLATLGWQRRQIVDVQVVTPGQSDHLAETGYGHGVSFVVTKCSDQPITQGVPLQNLACAVDLRVRERSGSVMIVDRVLPTPLSDHGVLVPMAGNPGVP